MKDTTQTFKTTTSNTALNDFHSETHGQVITAEMVRPIVNAHLEAVQTFMEAHSQASKKAAQQGMAKAQAAIEAFTAADGHQKDSGVVFYTDKIQCAAAWGYDLKALGQMDVLIKRSGKVSPKSGADGFNHFQAATNPAFRAKNPTLGMTVDLEII